MYSDVVFVSPSTADTIVDVPTTLGSVTEVPKCNDIIQDISSTVDTIVNVSTTSGSIPEVLECTDIRTMFRKTLYVGVASSTTIHNVALPPKSTFTNIAIQFQEIDASGISSDVTYIFCSETVAEDVEVITDFMPLDNNFEAKHK